MPGTPRVRTRQTDSAVTSSVYSYAVTGADVVDFGSSSNTTEYSPSFVRCEDVEGNRHKPNDLLISRYHIQPFSASGHQIIDSGYIEDGMNPNPPHTYIHNVFSHGDSGSYDFSPPSDLSDEALFTKFCGESNPSAADFDAAVFVGELRDVPGMLHAVGGQMSKYGANEYLRLQYGWKPFLKDISKMIHAYDRLAKRLLQAQRISAGLALKRRSRVFTEKFAGSETTDSVHNLRGSHDWTSIRTRWAVIEWVPEKQQDIISNLAPLTRNLAPLNQAKRALYGGTVDGNTLWQLMPWSWLLDWGTNASDYLASKRNIVGAKVGNNSSFMCTETFLRSSKFVPGPYDPNEVLIDFTSYPGYYGSVSKRRKVGMVPSIVTADAFNLIGKSAFKQSILGALGVQRLRRLPF